MLLCRDPRLLFPNRLPTFAGLVAVLILVCPTANGVSPDKDTLRSARVKTQDGKIKTAVESDGPAILFPNWQSRGFDWGLGPIAGGKAGTNSGDSGTNRFATMEGGVQGMLAGIPVVPGNPGANFAAHAGYALGLSVNAVTANNGNTETSKMKYTRIFGGVDLFLYVYFYRHTLGLTSGRLEYEDSHQTVQTAGISNDFGFLILTWLSGHYTNSLLQGFGPYMSRPFIQQNDNWLHGKLFTSIQSFYLDFGPGVTYVDEYHYDGNDNRQTSSGHTDYLLARSGVHIFWKFGLSGEAKYVYESSQEDLGGYATTRLPEDDLNRTPQLVAPADSLRANLFIGLQNFVYGTSLGYNYNVQVLKASNNSDASHQTIRSQGISLSAQTSI